VLNSYRDICLDIIKSFDTFSIKHIPREENSWANRLAQQASGYIVSQGVFWISSIEHRYVFRSRGKLMTENSDQLQVEGKPIPDNMNRLPRKTGPESEKTEPISGKIEPEPGHKISYEKKRSRLWLRSFKKSQLQRKMKWRRISHL
jgi:hypothetical protein